MDQVITFNKSLDERLKEYIDVLSQKEIMPASQIKKEWTYYLEMVLDYAGWQAVWKIPRYMCETFKIPYPTIVLAYVDQVNFEDLSAVIKILAVQDNISLTETHVVPLMELWPTEQQDTVCLNLPATANAVDMIRFFYNHLWMPWDLEDDDTSDWIAKHLKVRLRLHYDIKNGVLPRKTAEHLRSLLNEAKAMQSEREMIEEDLEDVDLDLESNVDNPDETTNEIRRLMTIHMRMSQIKSEIEILENPILRAIFIEKLNADKQNLEGAEPNYWLIFQQNLHVDEYLDYLESVKSIMPVHMKFKTAGSVQDATDKAMPNDKLMIGPGKHLITSTGVFEEGGVMRGVKIDRTETILESGTEGCMLDFSAEKASLENLTINSGNSQYAMVIRKGLVVLKNCILSGDETSPDRQGIIVLKGAALILENCEVKHFGTGIVANSDSEVILRETRIANCEIGMKIYNFSLVHMKDSVITECKYGISAEKDCEEELTENNVDLEKLMGFYQLTAENSSLTNNTDADGFIYKKTKIVPVQNLFVNPKYDNILNYTTLV